MKEKNDRLSEQVKDYARKAIDFCRSNLKLIGIVVGLIFLFSLYFFPAVCSGEKTSSSPQVDDQGNSVYEFGNRRTTFLDELPGSLPYGEKQITLNCVSVYENIVDFSYNLFIIAELDVSNLDENEIHWLRSSDISARAFISNEKNNYDTKLAPVLGNLLLTDSNKIYYVFTSSFSSENRHSFAKSSISVRFEVSVGDDPKTESISYLFNAPAVISNTDLIGDPLASYVSEWLYEKADALSGYQY